MILNALRLQNGARVAFVGAGGKTTLIFALANELAEQGYCVLITTTTAMFHPETVNLNYDEVILGDVINCNWVSLKKCGVFVAASECNQKNRKLLGFASDYVSQLSKIGFFDFVFVEADGSNMRSIKVPAEHEPVIPSLTSDVVGCIGLDCINKRVNSLNVHRSELLPSILDGAVAEKITEKHILSLIVSDEGLFKDASAESNKIVFLNKADSNFLLGKGIKLAHSIMRSCSHVKRTVVSCLKDDIDPIKLVV